VRLGSNTVAHGEVGNCPVDGDDLACGFTAQKVRVGDLPGPDAAVQPEVNIRTDDFRAS